MSRLIDADALMTTLGITDMDCVRCAWYSKSLRRCKRGGDFEDACCAIENAPTIEPRKGKWIKLYAGNYKCSECGDWWSNDDNDMVKEFRFCPNCGAEMSEGEGDA